jgi:hypothetical protein
MEDGSAYEIKTNCLQVDMARWQNLSAGGSLQMWQLLETSPRKLFLQALLQVEDRPDVVQLAERIQVRSSKEVRQHLIRYARGELSLEEAQQQVLATAEGGAVRMKSVLGEHKYAQVRDLLFSGEIVQFGFDGLISLQERASVTTSRPSDDPERSGASRSFAVVPDPAKIDLPSKPRQPIEDPSRFWTVPSVVEQSGLHEVQLYAKYLCSDGSSGYLPYESVSWASSDSTIASVDSRGMVEPKIPGTVTITAMANGFIAKAKVKSPAFRWLGPNDPEIRQTFVRIRAGESFLLSVKGRRDYPFTESPRSSDESIATVTYLNPSRYTHWLEVVGRRSGRVTISFAGTYATVEVTE